jgi:hypothetical protein
VKTLAFSYWTSRIYPTPQFSQQKKQVIGDSSAQIGPKMDSDDPRKPGKFQPKYIAKPAKNGVELVRHTFYPGGAKAHGIEDLSHDSGEQIEMPASSPA